MFDPMKPLETLDTVMPDLAEKWSWQDGYRTLVLFLRRDVKWHDGTPFTSRDVKFTFDMVREASDATQKLRINPRKEWYDNVEVVEAAEPHTVVFRLKRPQTSLLLMLASGDSPVLPAHVPIAEQRTRCVGTGPFRLKEWKRGEYVDYVRSPDYFVKGRPYLDGIRYLVVTERSTRTAALRAGRADVASPGDGGPQIAEQPCGQGMQDVDRPAQIQTLPEPARARRPRVEAEPLRLVPRPEGLNGIGRHRRRRRNLGQGPAIRPPESEFAIGLSIDSIALLVYRAVVPATEQSEVRERGRATLRPVVEVMSLAEGESAAREAAALVPVEERAPQRRGNRPSPGPNFRSRGEGGAGV